MISFDHPHRCTTCGNLKSMPYSWNSTVPPVMCSCPKSLAWECPRCKKINAPWKGSCDCTPSNINWSPTCESSYIGNNINKHEM
jgi:hypothetical protein